MFIWIKQDLPEYTYSWTGLGSLVTKVYCWSININLVCAGFRTKDNVIRTEDPFGLQENLAICPNLTSCMYN